MEVREHYLYTKAPCVIVTYNSISISYFQSIIQSSNERLLKIEQIFSSFKKWCLKSQKHLKFDLMRFINFSTHQLWWNISTVLFFNFDIISQWLNIFARETSWNDLENLSRAIFNSSICAIYSNSKRKKIFYVTQKVWYHTCLGKNQHFISIPTRFVEASS